MIESHDQEGPPAGDEELLADVIERITCRLESGEPIDPTEDIPRPTVQASRLRSLLPTIRDLVDLGRSGTSAGLRVSEVPDRDDSSGADTDFPMTEFTPDA